MAEDSAQSHLLSVMQAMSAMRYNATCDHNCRELKFLHRARKNPKRLGKAQMLHASTCLLGLSAFALEDYCPQLPLLHSAWHCLSAAGVSVVNNLLDDVEKCELGLIQ